MKEIQEWNPYYIGASCSLYRPEQFYPWLYPYGSGRHYISLWNDPEQMEDVEDKKRIMEMYPLMARRLQPYVEECCDRLAALRGHLARLEGERRAREEQQQALRQLSLWKRIAMLLSSCAAVLAWWGIAGSGLRFAGGVCGVVIALACAVCAAVIGRGIRNGNRNVANILSAAEQA